MSRWLRPGQLPNDDFDDRAVVTDFFGPRQEDSRYILHSSNIGATSLPGPAALVHDRTGQCLLGDFRRIVVLVSPNPMGVDLGKGADERGQKSFRLALRGLRGSAVRR